jgi:hypothetical protein
MWEGDGNVTTRRVDDSNEPTTKYEVPAQLRLHKKTGKGTNRCLQTRILRQSRLFITYSLHRAVTNEKEGQLIMKKMADAAYELFGNDKWLAHLIVMGQKLHRLDVARGGTDNVSRAVWGMIDGPNKVSEADDAPQWYGDETRTSYLYDTYETHVNKVELDGGIEIGPAACTVSGVPCRSLTPRCQGC